MSTSTLGHPPETSPILAADPPAARPTPPATRRGLPGALAGSAMEVFDWTIYSAFAPFFAAAFFGGAENNTKAFLQTLIVFAVGFIARPIGSLVFGHVSDTRGRRVSLYLTSATALVGTLMIALSPSHHQIGIWAAVVLVCARIVQGLAHGGEQPAAGAYISEIAQPHNRGAWSSLVYVSIMGGSVLGTLLGAILTGTLGAGAVHEWGWRIAFGVGALGTVGALLLVRRLPETQVFQQASELSRPSVWSEMWRARREALKIIGLTIGLTIAFQNWASIGSYHIAVLKANPTHVLWTGVAINLLTLAVLPLWGRLSDRIGRRPVLFIGFGGLALTTWPLMHFLDGSATRMAIAMGASMVLLAGPLAITPALMAELVPTSIRTIGVGFAYALATAMFGGTVPALQTCISGRWGAPTFGAYVTIAVLVSMAVTLVTPETRGKDLTLDTQEAVA